MKQFKMAMSMMICSIISFLIFMRPVAVEGNVSKKLEMLVEGLDSNGDCIIMRYGDVQILIDAAETKDAFEKISNDMSKYMEGDEEKIWEYIIFTHPDSDHIGNAVKVLDYIDKSDWSIGTVIDYGSTDKNTTVVNSYSTKLDAFYEINQIEYFDASSLNQQNSIKEYRISSDCRLLILYNETYAKSSDNDLSVCCLIEYKNQKLLFTGDLEEAGEKNLIKNHSKLLEGVTFFKAGHHGSNSSNCESFVDTIRPEYVAITLEKNSDGQNESLTNFLKYTDYIFPTYVYYLDAYYMMYGDLFFSFDGEETTVTTEANNDLEGEEKNIRNANIEFYGDNHYNWYDHLLSESTDLEDEIMVYTLDEEQPSHSNCSLVKYGHYDILVDCGSTLTDSMAFVEKLKKYVVDNRIEYVIVTHYQVANISQLIGNYKNNSPLKNGVFDQFEIGSIIDGEPTNLANASESGFYKKYLSRTHQNKKRTTVRALATYEKDVASKRIALKVIGSNVELSSDENDYSLSFLISFHNQKMLFVGDRIDYSYLVDNFKSDITNLAFLRISNATVSKKDATAIDQFAELTNPKYSVVGSALGYTMPNGKIFANEQMQIEWLSLYKSDTKSNIYFCGYINDHNEYIPENGDLIFSIKYSGEKMEYVMKAVKRSSLVCLDNNF